MRDNYKEAVLKIAPMLENGFVSQDDAGTDFTLMEPELKRGTGEARDSWSWTVTKRKHAPNILSELFREFPVHPEPQHTLYEIKDGVAVHIPTV